MSRRTDLALKIEQLVQKQGAAPSYPSLLKMAGNLVGSIKDVVSEAALTGDVLVDEMEFIDRLEICCECCLFDPVPVRCTHEDCGCFLKLKGWLLAVNCPLYKWPGDAERQLLGLEEPDHGEEEEDEAD